MATHLGIDVCLGLSPGIIILEKHILEISNVQEMLVLWILLSLGLQRVKRSAIGGGLAAQKPSDGFVIRVAV